MTLRKIFDKHGTDKGTKHCYDVIYETLITRDPCNLLEIGIYHGKSMAAWKEYLPQSKIYGIDIFTRDAPENISILNMPDIFWVKGNSTKSNIVEIINDKFGVLFDYIIDDGEHSPTSNKLTFKHIHKFLKPGGLYIIEDVWPLDKMSQKELGHQWLVNNPQKYNYFEYEMFLNELEKSGLEIIHYDNRKVSGKPDSYIIVIKNKSKGNVVTLPTKPHTLYEMELEDSLC